MADTGERSEIVVSLSVLPEREGGAGAWTASQRHIDGQPI